VLPHVLYSGSSVDLTSSDPTWPAALLRPTYTIETGKRTVKHTYGADGLSDVVREQQQSAQRRHQRRHVADRTHADYPDLDSASLRRQRRRLLMRERGLSSPPIALTPVVALARPPIALAVTPTVTATATAAVAAATTVADAAAPTLTVEPSTNERHGNLTVPQLKELLRGLSLPVGGTKAVLLDRLRQSGGTGSDAEGAATEEEEDNVHSDCEVMESELEEVEIAMEIDEEERAGGRGGLRGERRAFEEARVEAEVALAAAGGRRVGGRKRKSVVPHEAAWRARY
jgi:hypothetical protein